MVTNITKLKHRFPLKQLRRIPRFLRRIWPIIALILISLVLCYSNYEPGTFLTGWDNLHPEFNLATNIQRAFFSVWQEYRSLGLLGGMAHAADLPRMVLILIFSQNNISLDLSRYLTNFLPLIIGPLGVYFLFYHHIFKDKLDSKTTQFASFFGALFYLLNLNTLQTFFVPFETFTWFYGSFPWLLYFIISYLEYPVISRLVTLFITSLFAAPSFYVETIFLVFIATVLPFFIEFIHHNKYKLPSLNKSFLSLFAIITPHLFWLLPVAFFVITSGHVAETARINLVSSPETYARNLQFGNVKDVGLLKGYLFNYLDLTGDLKYDYLLSIWRNHLSNPLIRILGYITSFVALIGIYYSFKKKFPWTFSFTSALFICLFFLLGGGVLINQIIPLVGELFRSPFTKFSIPFSLLFSFFFAIGTIFVLDLFTFLHSKFTYYLTLFTITIILILYMSPAFSGNLISGGMRREIPQEYFDLFTYLNNQDKSARVANFPQNSFWGWAYYDWGYRGSGFLWEGIKQPLLDRAFDVWNLSSEKYYEEISSALFSGNEQKFASILDKYDIKWLLLDKHVITPDGKTSLGTETLEKFLQNTEKYSETKNWNDKIFLYSVKNTNPSQNFLSLSESTPSDTLSPFTSLSLRPNTDWIYKSDFISTSKQISPKQGEVLHLPSLSTTENYLPVRVEYRKMNNYISFRLTPISPTIFAGTKQINLDTTPTEISVSLNDANTNFILQLDHQFFEVTLPAEILEFSDYFPLATLYLPTKKSFSAMIYNGAEENIYDLTNILSQTNPTQCYIEKPNRKIEKITTSDSISLLGTDVVGCLSARIPQVPTDSLIAYSYSYSSPTLTLANVNISGRDFNALEIPQAQEPKKEINSSRQFANSTGKYQQINLVLEAADTKTVQEIQYKDITITTHSLLFSTSIKLHDIPKQDIALLGDEKRIQISLPITDTQFDISETPNSNSLFPENGNCDQFNQGATIKKSSNEGILYQSQNAIECDYLNLRQLDHSLNYLISFDYLSQKGLPMTTCFENYTTRRCDVFERLISTSSTQSLIQPIANPEEGPGYTLHLFTQSIGKKISSGLLKSLSIRPIPLNFLQSISINSSPVIPGTDPESIQITPSKSTISSTHPAEFLYTASVIASPTFSPRLDRGDSDVAISPSKNSLNLFQTKSSYWKAVVVSPKDLSTPVWLLTLKLFFAYPLLEKLPHTDGLLWHNSWSISDTTTNNQESTSLVIIYLPQYLEFIGLAFIPFAIIAIIFPKLSHRKKAK